MNTKISIILLCFFAIGLVGNGYAHKSEVIDDYKISVGWKNEPPIVGVTNSVEIIVVVANEFDKKLPDHDESMEHEGMTHEEHKEETELAEEMEHQEHGQEMEKIENYAVLDPGTGIADLGDKLEAVISLEGQKTELEIIEQMQDGVYHAVYTPSKEGFASVNLVGAIGSSEFEITFHPEKIESLNTLRPLQQIKANIVPDDIQCKEDLQLVLGPSGRPACVFETSVLKLMERNWIQ